MKTNYLLFSMLLAAGLPAMAQNVVKVGKGSYASYTPLNMCYSEDHKPGDWGWKGDKSRDMQVRKIYLTERENQPIPTNDWWPNLITEQYSGNLWSYPQMIKATSAGLDIQQPSFWIADGTEMKSNTVLTVGGEKFKPASAVAEHWHDWDVEFSMKEGNKQMYVTMAHGTPFTWIETQGISPTLQLQKSGWKDTDYQDTDTRYLDAQGNEIVGNYQGSQFIMERGGDLYGVYLPQGSTVTIGSKNASVSLSNPKKGYVVVAMLHQVADLEALAPYALNVPRDTRVSWKYDAAQGKMKTVWHIDADNLSGASAQQVLMGFLPHLWRDTGCDVTLPFTGTTYRTPHGLLKMAAGNDFEVDYKFYGMLPYWAVPEQGDSQKNPYDEAKMLQMLSNYADKGSFGSDTYWGGKGLTQMALYMMMAREMGKKELFEQCRDRLKETMVNWLTYTPGEKNFFFARYDRWGAMVGYSTSYDSDTFNDHHFHYGYYTLAGALLALVDDDFRDNYGQMLRLVAKDYANWDHEDTQYPFFRTFDPWAGHSFAGGMGDGNGNGQESSSEAMQSWGGLYLLGVALGDDEMRDAGIFGWLSEARGTAEYWFDRHRDNIDYEKFKHPYNSNLTCHGVGWWTYFGYQNLYMAGIQWMPTSTALDYLSENKEFAYWDYNQLFTDPGKTEDRDASNGDWFSDKENSLDKSGDWGNVTLSYLQRGNPDEAAPVDIRESLLMPNLALHKPCTESGHENVGTVPENATDGDDNTRWGSLHNDGEWIQVDLQQKASLYKLRIHWEAAYASEYTVALSDDGEHFTYTQDVTTSGDWDDVLLGDHKARYVRIIGKKRATAYGISLYEIQVMGRPEDATDSDVAGIQITAAQDVLKQYQDCQLAVKGYTYDGQWKDLTDITYSSQDGEVSSQGMFAPSEYGEATVQVKLPGKDDVYEKQFPVEEALYPRYVSIEPRVVKMVADGTPEKIDVQITDQFKAPISPVDGAVSYRIMRGEEEVESSDAQFDPETCELKVWQPGTYSLIVDAGKTPAGAAIADTISVEAKLFANMNLAYQKPATVSSQNGDGSGAEKAVDGDATATRWESQWGSDDENLTVDLENTYEINKVVIFWENARASKYEIQTSLDGKEWTTAKKLDEGKVGGETIEFTPVEARFVRMQGLGRVMEAYGYSIYELEVYGTRLISTGIDTVRKEQLGDAQKSKYIYDLNGRMVSNGSRQLLRPGIYVRDGKKFVVR